MQLFLDQLKKTKNWLTIQPRLSQNVSGYQKKTDI